MSRRPHSPTTDLVNNLRRSGAPKWVVVIIVLAVLAFQYWNGPQDLDRETAPSEPPAPAATYVVQRVVDGDTLLLEGGERVRLLGVDTPETVREDYPVEPLGPEASRFTKQRANGKSVELRFDKERRDRHGRMLAYVYIDGVLLNEELIRQGFSRAQLQHPYKNSMKQLFQEAEADARAARRGLWSLDDNERR